ncbi:MAG: helix-turn-helix domain-containing protein [Cyanobacteria bacterium P01_A01_bin.83]
MYIHTTQAASLLGISPRRLRKLLQDKRVKGAYKSGKFWLIPLYEGLPVITKAKRGQAGTWKIGKRLQKQIIHINSNIIKQNIKKSPPERKPAIAVKGAQLGYVNQLEIPAPCRIIYQPDKPLPCGARVWIEVLNCDLKLIAG